MSNQEAFASRLYACSQIGNAYGALYREGRLPEEFHPGTQDKLMWLLQVESLKHAEGLDEIHSLVQGACVGFAMGASGASFWPEDPRATSLWSPDSIREFAAQVEKDAISVTLSGHTESGVSWPPAVNERLRALPASPAGDSGARGTKASLVELANRLDRELPERGFVELGGLIADVAKPDNELDAMHDALWSYEIPLITWSWPDGSDQISMLDLGGNCVYVCWPRFDDIRRGWEALGRCARGDSESTRRLVVETLTRSMQIWVPDSIRVSDPITAADVRSIYENGLPEGDSMGPHGMTWLHG